MRRRILLLSLAVLCLVTAAGSFAYFTDEGVTENVITAGNIRIALILEGEGENLMPGVPASLRASIRNAGDHPAFVRLELDTEVTPGLTGADSGRWLWREGYYYYDAPLAPGATTEPLEAGVLLPPELDNRYQNGKARVQVTAYAVQTAHNGTDPLTAAGWPEGK